MLLSIDSSSQFSGRINWKEESCLIFTLVSAARKGPTDKRCSACRLRSYCDVALMVKCKERK